MHLHLRTEKTNSKLHHAVIMVSFLFLLVPGCTHYTSLPSSSTSTPETTPPFSTDTQTDVYVPELGPAASLYRHAETSLAQGLYRQAELELERALRIEPRNAHYWHTMGKIKFSQNLYEQSIQFCLKSKSLAGRNRQLIRLNDALIDKAQKGKSS